MNWPNDYLIPGVEPYHVEEAGVIYCADCRDILPHLPKVDLVLTDPPYGCGKEYANDDMFDVQFHKNYLDYLAKLSDSLIIFFGFRKNLLNFLMLTGYPRQIITWCKPNAPMRKGQKYYHFSTEWFFWFTKNDDVYFDIPKGEDGRDYWRIPVNNGFLRESSWFHSASKPIALFKKIISVHCDKNKTILDPFLGSGTTAVAAKELGRRFIGIEISEEYCQIAVKRLRQGVFKW